MTDDDSALTSQVVADCVGQLPGACSECTLVTSSIIVHSRQLRVHSRQAPANCDQESAAIWLVSALSFGHSVLNVVD